jgi:hypothetical protein
VGGANLALASPALGDALAGSGHADVEVHTVDTASVLAKPLFFLFFLTVCDSIRTQCWGRT